MGTVLGGCRHAQITLHYFIDQRIVRRVQNVARQGQIEGA
jgi:hypothetical protein